MLSKMYFLNNLAKHFKAIVAINFLISIILRVVIRIKQICEIFFMCRYQKLLQIYAKRKYFFSKRNVYEEAVGLKSNDIVIYFGMRYKMLKSYTFSHLSVLYKIFSLYLYWNVSLLSSYEFFYSLIMSFKNYINMGESVRTLQDF